MVEKKQVYHINVKIHVQVHFTIASQFLRLREGGILRSHKSGIIFTPCVHLYGGEKNGYVKCFCNSSGTDIGANNSSQSRSSE